MRRSIWRVAGRRLEPGCAYGGLMETYAPSSDAGLMETYAPNAGGAEPSSDAGDDKKARARAFRRLAWETLFNGDLS